MENFLFIVFFPKLWENNGHKPVADSEGIVQTPISLNSPSTIEQADNVEGLS